MIPVLDYTIKSIGWNHLYIDDIHIDRYRYRYRYRYRCRSPGVPVQHFCRSVFFNPFSIITSPKEKILLILNFKNQKVEGLLGI